MKNKKLSLLIKIICASYSAIYIYQAAFGFWEPQWSRGLYIGFAMVLAFLIYPQRKKEATVAMQMADVGLAIVSIGLIAFFIYRFEYYAINAGILLGPIDLAVGILLIVFILEACRRCVGLSLPLISAIFIIYCLVGDYLPNIIGHKGFSLNRVVSVMYAGTEGIFGSVAYTFCTYIFLFIIFGAFLQKSGAGAFFIDISKAAVGRLPGGAGQASVVSSWILGSIMGSSTANTAITGAITIPLMIENGYKKHVAASVEAVVSIGGQFMPPIMGAAAFIMAATLGVPYGEVAMAGIVPAILFFISMILMVYLEAKRTNLKPLPESEVPKMSEVMKSGWYYLIPIVVIVVFLSTGASPTKAGFWSIISTLAVSQLNKEKRMGVKEAIDALVDGAKSSLSIAATAGPIGMLIAAISLPGLGMKISSIIVQVSGDFLPIALLLVMGASFILGMGMNVTSAYLLLATLTAPALTELGVPLMSAHFFVFWTSQLAVITPPVCLSAYVAASIANADVWKTGWYSLRMGLAIYYLPIMFVFAPELLLVGSASSIVYSVVCAFIGVVCFSIFSQGFFLLPITSFERVMIGLASLMVILSGFVTDTIGVALIIVFILVQLARRKRLSATL